MVARQTVWGNKYPEFGKSKDVLSELCNLQLKPTKTLECYMVKPHGQLVLVSFIHY